MSDEADNRQSVYLETTIFGFLTARPSRVIVQAARQQLTQQWWDEERGKYRTFASAHVIEEARAGDPIAAARRLDALATVEMLAPAPELELLAARLQQSLQLPLKARFDAMHVAYAVYYELDYLLTWNCTHLANGETLRRLTDFLRGQGLWQPIICTPQEMVPESETESNVP
jgi:hypothetical protein